MKTAFALAATALCAVSTGISAAQLSASGQNVFTCDLKSVTLEEGHSMMVGNWKGIQVTHEGAPDNNSTIDCVGTFEGMPDKSFKIGGYCLHTDKDGDKWLDRWWNDSTMKVARWEGIGISGKWLELKKPTGSFMYADLSTEAGCKGVSSWKSDGR
jgi:hypothetical protein